MFMDNVKIIAGLVSRDVELVKSKRAKRISITVKPFKPVRVSIPMRESFKHAKEFAQSHVKWIEKNIAKIEAIEQKHIEAEKKRGKIDVIAAKKYLKARLKELAGMNGFEYNRIFVRNQKTLWGSCSAKNNINLNINLVHLPEYLSDYVMFHELVHTKIKSHGNKFWKMLDKYVGNAKKLNKELAEHRYGLDIG